MGDETYIHYYTPTSKQQNMAWCELGEPAPKNSAGQIIATVLYDWRSILLLVYHFAGISTTQDTCEMLKALQAAIRCKHPVMQQGHRLTTGKC